MLTDFVTKINLDTGVIDTLDIGNSKNVLVLMGTFYSPKAFKNYIEPLLKELKVTYHVYSGIPVNLTSETVYMVTNFARNKKIDCIISCGGAAPMDCGKLVSLLLSQGGLLHEYLADKEILPSMIHHITIPTLSGAGSEISPNAFFILNKGKKVISNPYLVPNVTYVDPMIMKGVSKLIWACIGFECFAAAIAAYISPHATYTSDTFAEAALERYKKFMPKLLNDTDSIEYIKEIEVASMNAFIASGFAGTGAMHALANTLSAEFNFRQGIALAMVAGEVCEYHYEYNKEKFDKLLHLLDSKDDIKTTIEKHIKKIGLTLPSIKKNLEQADLENLARECMNYTTKGNPKFITIMEVVSILKNIP